MPGAKPNYRFIVKPEGAEKFNEIGAAWKRAGSENFGVTLTLPDGSKMTCLMVPNVEKPAPAAAKPAAKAKHPAAHKPAA